MLWLRELGQWKWTCSLCFALNRRCYAEPQCEWWWTNHISTRAIAAGVHGNLRNGQRQGAPCGCGMSVLVGAYRRVRLLSLFTSDAYLTPLLVDARSL